MQSGKELALYEILDMMKYLSRVFMGALVACLAREMFKRHIQQ